MQFIAALLLILAVNPLVPSPPPNPSGYVGRTDTNVQQLPAPMPNWGGANGAGNKWINPNFPGGVLCRVTDSATARLLKTRGTMQTADSGEPQLVSSDGKYVFVRDTGAYTYVVKFDKATCSAVKTPVGFNYNAVSFSSKSPMIIWALSGTQIHKITGKPAWAGILSDQIIFNYASPKCLGISFASTWNAIFTVASDNATFKTAFSNTGGQGSGFYTVAWSAAKGCSVLNSKAGTVSNNGVLLGSIDNGAIPAVPLIDRFLLHEGGNGTDPNYAMVTATINGPNKTPGCLAGKCLVDQPYVWQAFTTHVRPCSLQCSGHSTKGISGFYTGKKQVFHPYNNPNSLLVPMIVTPNGFPDQHGSAHNQNSISASDPIFIGSSANEQTVTPYPVWGYNEIIAVSTDGSLDFTRVGQTGNSGKSPYFICASAIMVSDQLGQELFFTSDMGGNGALGYEPDGKTSRCDVFALILTPKP